MIAQPLDPLEFLDLAQVLGSQEGEAELRTAVGRAFYAILLIAREKTGVRGRRKIYKRVRKTLAKRRGYLSTAGQLAKLARLRYVADYELLPESEADRDWARNWSTAQDLANHILPRLQAW